jgi:hypothetical protein
MQSTLTALAEERRCRDRLMRIDESVSIDASPRGDLGDRHRPDSTRSSADRSRAGSRGGQGPRLGARYTMRMRVGSAEVGGLVEVVEWDERATWRGPASRASTSAALAAARAGGRDARGRLRLPYTPRRLLG